jgi:hypothetical protein
MLSSIDRYGVAALKIQINMRKILLAGASGLFLLLGSGCEPSDAGAENLAEPDIPPPGAGVVDSIFPIEEEIRRFRETLAEHPQVLANTEATREDLVRRFVGALETADSSDFRRMALTRPEFAYLYYPTTQYTKRPYELSPALVWYRMESYSSRGLTRALQRHGGQPLNYAGHQCEDEPTVQGDNRIWHGCVIHSRQPCGDTVTLSLLGPILERGGRFKLLSYANGL